MTAWTSDILDRIGTADELRITPDRPDGTPGKAVPIWVVRDGDDLYIRSYRGQNGAWYRAARATGHGRISAAGLDITVTLTPVADAAANDRLDAAYLAKYGRYGDAYTGPMTAAPARATTLRIGPA
ncbi:DUF2255 family protein [[Actinomadura] parvosata]|uniref:DUF2255 family protein n=1 Tax=[Actinomadura] parvosata TaxID=1955412 RepID=UPI00406CE06F